MVSVKFLADGEEGDWKNYIINSKDSNFFHQIEWKDVLKSVYGYESFYLIARKDNKPCGVLPIFQTKSISGKKKLKSLPFHFYGGPLYDNNEVLKELLKKAKKIFSDTRAEYLEVKSNLDFEGIEDMFLIKKTKTYTSYITEISLPEDELFWKLKKNVRWSIKNSDDKIREITKKSDIKIFYDIYFECMKDLGNPGHPLKLFETILDAFSENIRITIAYSNGRPVATIFLLLFKDTMLYMWGARDPKFKRSNANPALHWDAFKWGQKNGYKYFDFGMTSPDEKSANFYKSRWNTKKVSYDFFVLFGKTPKTDYHTSFSLLKIVWKLIPSFIGKRMAPIVKYVG